MKSERKYNNTYNICELFSSLCKAIDWGKSNSKVKAKSEKCESKNEK